MKPDIKEKGKYVSRAAYAKIQGEKNRLYNDIRILVENKDGMAREIFNKWRKHFKDQREIIDIIREIAKKELPALRAKLDSNPKAFK